MLQFTYNSYSRLLNTISKNGYVFSDYYNHNKFNKCCILRHDVDFDVNKAVEFALFENDIGVHSTYFFLLSTNFYNLMSYEMKGNIERILKLGHSIGLHFDEVRYLKNGSTNNSYSNVSVVESILYEIDLMKQMLGVDVTVVSMHRPSQDTLNSDLVIPNIINSYSKEFFKDFKYYSDSRMRWREDVYQGLLNGEYNKIHLLTHPIWYDKCAEKSIKDVLRNFIEKSRFERYDYIKDNITDLDSILIKEEL